MKEIKEDGQSDETEKTADDRKNRTSQQDGWLGQKSGQIGKSEQIEQRIIKSRENYMDIKIPDEGCERMKAAIEQAKQEKEHSRRRMRRWMYGFSMAAIFALVFLIPNSSKASAQVLMELPVLGRFFEVITIRDYQFDDGYSRANVQIPKLDGSGLDDPEENSALADINRNVEEYTNEILERFEENQKLIGDKGHQSLDISYEVLTNTEHWFTLEVTVDEVQGSGYEYKNYYHIDKSTGKMASLKDVFLPGSHYLEIISVYIKEQMEQYNKENPDGEVYWIGKSEFTDGYEGIDEDQSFYFDQQNRLVIIFNEYEVAPGYMGMPEFVIPQYLIRDMRRT